MTLINYNVPISCSINLSESEFDDKNSLFRKKFREIYAKFNLNTK